MKPIRSLITVTLVSQVLACGAAPQTAPAADPAAPASSPAAVVPAAAPAGSPLSAAPPASAPNSREVRPVEPRSVEPTPTPAPKVRMVVPAGTILPIELQSTLSSDASKEGDAVLAVLTEDVALDGFTLDKGAEVRGRIYTAVPAKRVKGRAHLVFGFEAVMENREKITIETEAIDTLAASTSSKDKKIIGGSAIGGLIVGAIKDGKKGAAIGTVIGAAAGGGAVLIMKGDEVEIPRGARLSVVVSK